MNEGSLVTLKGLKLFSAPKENELQALLEVIPHPAFLIDSRSHRIDIANTLACELSGYTHAEVEGIEIELIFPTWKEQNPIEALTPTEGERWITNPQTIQLRTHNSTRTAVQLSFFTQLPNSNRQLILLEATNNQFVIAKDRRNLKIGQSIERIIHLIQHDKFVDALNDIIRESQFLTNANTIGVYLADEKSPLLNRIAYYGNEDCFPDQLSAQDLIHLQTPHLWKPGRRQLASIHRTARCSNLTFLASAPLGQPNAVIGLIVVGDTEHEPTDYVMQIVQILAATISALLNAHIAQSKVAEVSKAFQLYFAIASTLENAIHDGLILLGPDLSIQKVNPTAETMFGYTNQEVLRQHIDNLLIGANNIHGPLQAAQQGVPTPNLGVQQVYRRNGDAFQVNIRVVPVMDDQQLVGILLLIQDTSEKEQIRAQAQQLEQRAGLGEVTAVFAHEVRNPINNLSTGLELLSLNLSPSDPNQELITRLLQDCDRLADLMKSVLAYSKRSDYSLEPLDLKTILQRLLDRIRPQLDKAQIEPSLQIERDCPPVMGNAPALEQVFINIFNNAIKAMSGKGGKLAVKTQRLKTEAGLTYVQVSIADTGPGIAKEDQEHIFQPFYTTNQQGTGLGLAIAKRIITAHKGTIRLTSFPGGTVFYIHIPAVDTQ